jgi:hypothetical protein
MWDLTPSCNTLVTLDCIVWLSTLSLLCGARMYEFLFHSFCLIIFFALSQCFRTQERKVGQRPVGYTISVRNTLEKQATAYSPGPAVMSWNTLFCNTAVTSLWHHHDTKGVCLQHPNRPSPVVFLDTLFSLSLPFELSQPSCHPRQSAKFSFVAVVILLPRAGV